MKHTLFILALITASIQTFAQSPRIKLNQITKDSLAGSVLISSTTDSGMVYSRDLFISYGADTVLILGGDTLAATSGIISSVLSDGVTITGDGTIGSELTADTSVLATLRALSDSLALVISSVTADNVTITGDGTVGSPLTVDTATVVSSVGRLLDSLVNVRTDLDLKQDQLNGTGFVKATGTTITYDNSTYLTSEVDGSVTNEIQDISTTGAAGNISISSGSTLNLNVDDADASTSNELQTLSYNSSTNEITLSDGGGTEDLSNLDLVDSTRINATGDTAYYYQNGVLIGTEAIAGGGGSSFNNISETVDTVYISDYLDVDNNTLYVDADNNRVGVGTKTPGNQFQIVRDGNAAVYSLTTYRNSTGQSTAQFNFARGSEASPAIVQNGDYIGELVFNAYTGSDFSAGQVASIFTKVNGTVTSSPFSAPSDLIFATSAAGTAYASPRLTIKSDGDIFVNDLYANTTSGGRDVQILSTGELYAVSSSTKEKNTIIEYDKGLSHLMQLNPKYFKYNNDNSGRFFAGFIAEEFDEIGLNEFVVYGKNGVIDGIDYDKTVALLTKAIQEQQAIIESQSSEIEQLKTLITDLSNRLQILENN